MAADRPTPSESHVRAVEAHIDGWKSATFGWQDDPDPAVARQNMIAAIEAHAAECLRRIRVTLGVPAAPEALGWLNPDTGKTCSAAEKLSMEQHQGLPGMHIAKGFSVPLVRGTDGVSVLDGKTVCDQTPMDFREGKE